MRFKSIWFVATSPKSTAFSIRLGQGAQRYQADPSSSVR